MDTEAAFDVWLQLIQREPARFSLSFRVHKGVALLRVPRPAMARPGAPEDGGELKGLSRSQLRHARLLHRWESGRRRRAFALGRLPEDLSRRLRPGAWYALRAVIEGEVAHLLLAGDQPSFIDGQSLPALRPVEPGGPTPPTPSLSLTSPGRMRAFRHMRRHSTDGTGALERAFTGTDDS